MSLLRQFAGQTVIYGLGNILSKVFYFLVITSYLTNRFEETSEYGLYGSMYGFATLLVFSYRVDTAFFRFGSKEGTIDKSFSSAFIPLLFTTTFLVLMFIAFSSGISQLFGYEDYPHYFRWFAIIIGIDVISLVPFGKLRLENRAKTFVLLRIGNVVFSVILLLYFLEIYLPANPDGGLVKQIFPGLSNMVDYVFIGNLISSLFLFIALCFTIGKVSWKVDWGLWKKMVLYASPLIIVGIANSINQHFAPIIQNNYLPGDAEQKLSEVGIYTATLKLATLLALFNTAFNYAAEPFFFRNAANRNDKTIYAKVLNLYTICAVLCLVGLIYYIDIVKFIIGSEFRAGLYMMPILLFSFLMLGIYYNVSIWYKLADKNIYGGIISCVGVIVTLLLSITLIPKIGYLASAWASLACYSIMVLLAFYFGNKHYPIDYDKGKLLGFIVSATVMVMLAIGIDQLNLSYVISILIKTILFLSFGFFLFKQNKNLFMELIKPSEYPDVLTSDDTIN